jgi:DNA-binding NarL/FixJ family response regulator
MVEMPALTAALIADGGYVPSMTDTERAKLIRDGRAAKDSADGHLNAYREALARRDAAIRALYLSGMGDPEIAEALGMKKATVRSALTDLIRARRVERDTP